MTLEEFYKELPGGDWRSVVVRNLVRELIQNEQKEEILASWCDEENASDKSESKLFCYILTDKRFFEIRVQSDSFSYKSYFLKHLNSFREKVVPYCNEPGYLKKSAYFSTEDCLEGVSSYKVEFSFAAAKSESYETMFSFSTSFFPSSSDSERIHFKKLRDFVRAFHQVVPNL